MDEMIIAQWQADYYACPVVFGVWVRCGDEETLDRLYDSEDAAKLERDWFNSRNKNGYYGKAFVRRHHVANLELAQRRVRFPTTNKVDEKYMKILAAVEFAERALATPAQKVLATQADGE